jgi:hypothetical protein
MSITKDYWQMGADWRYRNFTFMVNGVKIPMSPYIKRISLGRTIGCDICVPQVELLSLRLATRITECDNNMGAIIVAKIDRIREYMKMLKNYGAHIEDPLNSRILVASSTCKPHYDYCKIECKILQNKVLITTQSYLKTIIGNFEENYPWMIITNDDLPYNVKNKVYISSDISQGGYDIRTILLTESIKPTLNITHARGFNYPMMLSAIKNHVDKCGYAYILANREFSINGYHVIPVEDGVINIHNTRNMPRTNVIHWQKSPLNNIIPVDNIICFNDDLAKYNKIFMKPSKYNRTLNILCIYTNVEMYIYKKVSNNYIQKYKPQILPNNIITDRTKIFAVFGIDIFELGKFEQYVIFYSFPKDKRQLLMNVWKKQTDNKLKEEIFARLIM